jgi:Fe-S-cluster containining protein
MNATFVTHDHGTIEVEKGGEAYFRKYDYLAPVDADGMFADPWGRRFEVLWPFRAGQGGQPAGPRAPHHRVRGRHHHPRSRSDRMSKLECDHCGACCTTLIIEVEHLDVVREPRLAPPVTTPCRLLEGEGEWDRQYMLAIGTATGGCPMHVDGRCSIHPTRPNTCVAFEAGSPDCQRARYHAGKPPLGRDAWPTDEDEFCKFVGEDFSTAGVPVIDLAGDTDEAVVERVIDLSPRDSAIFRESLARQDARPAEALRQAAGRHTEGADHHDDVFNPGPVS